MKSKVIQIRLGMVSAFVVKGERSILVDTGTPGSEIRIINRMSEAGVNPRDIDLIVITHAHADHFGSLAEMKKITKAKIVVHKGDAEHLRKGTNAAMQPAGLVGKLFLPLVGSRQYERVEPDIVIDGAMTLSKYGIQGEIIETPGHTPGSLSVMLENGACIVGDLIMGGVLLGKRPGYPYFVSDMEMLKESIDKLMSYSPKKIFTSHGGPFSGPDIEGLRRGMR